jgi:large subunit ribosomal protein L15
MVYTQAVFAIIGALALEKGGAVANQVAKERILEPLGMKRKQQPKLRGSQ